MYVCPDQENSFMLIPRGECTFVQKALHAQEMGAAMAIIMDNEKHKLGIIMKDDGYGTGGFIDRLQGEHPRYFHQPRDGNEASLAGI